jgi:hypothetical protein
MIEIPICPKCKISVTMRYIGDQGTPYYWFQCPICRQGKSYRKTSYTLVESGRSTHLKPIVGEKTAESPF